MEKKGINPKQGSVSLQGRTKESFSSRLGLLIGNRSIRAAAKDWGLSFSTLNNYLKLGTEPALNVAQRIAGIEKVSLEWLAGADVSDLVKATDTTPENMDSNRAAWMAIYESMSIEESQNLLRTVHRRGIFTLLLLAEDENAELLMLPTKVKKIALMLKSWPSEKLREISADLEGNEHENPPVTMHDGNQKKAV